MEVTVEIMREADDRWMAEVPELPGVKAYGQTPQEAIERVRELAERALAERDPADGPDEEDEG